MATGIQTSVQRGRRSGIVSRPTEKKFWEKGVDFWVGLNGRNKGLICGGLALLFTASLWGSLTFKSNQLVELYPLKMDALDVKEVSMALSDGGLDHTVSPTQDSVQLHPENLRAARARLATLALPRNQPGSVIEPATMSSTSDERRLIEKRRLESDLVYTIRQMEGINDARVTLAYPKSNYFEDHKKVTASVFLKSKGQLDLDKQSISGIASMVAHSVPELQASDVAVLDHNGREISSKEEPGSFEMQVQADQEKHLQEKLQKALSRIYGDNVHAVVDLTLDFSEEEQRRYTPGSPADDGMVKESFQLVTELLDGASPGKAKNYEQRKEAGNYKFAENYLARLRKNAKVERISATVLVNGASPEELKDVKGIVAGAIGVDESRNDSIFVSGVPWDDQAMAAWKNEPLAVSEMTAAPQKDSNPIALGLFCALGGGIVFLVGRHLLNSKKPMLAVGLGGSGSKSVNGIVDHHHSKDGSNTILEAPTSKQGSRMDALEELVGSQPNKVATLLRSTWLNN